MKRLLAVSIAVLGMSAGLSASDLTLILNPSTAVYPPGNSTPTCELAGAAPCVIFSGVLTDDDTDTSLMALASLSLDFGSDPSAEAYFNVDSTFDMDVPGLFSGDPSAPGDGNPFPYMYTGPIFGIDIAPSTPYGIYQLAATVSAFGGTNDPSFSGFTTETAFTLVVAPEPSGNSLIAAGLAVLFACHRFRPRPAQC